MKPKIKESKVSGKKTIKPIEPPVSLDEEIFEEDKKDSGYSVAGGEPAAESSFTAEGNEDGPSLTSDLVVQQERRNARSNSLVWTVIVSLIIGLGGGVVGSLYLAPIIQNNFGLPNRSVSEVRQVTLDENSAIMDVVKEANPAVVSIIISKDLPKIERQYFDPFSGEFSDPFSFAPSASGQTEKRQIGAGSGFIVSSDGLIITNKHVVSDDKAEYTVITLDGKHYTGKVLAKDPLNDLAVVKIDAKDLPTIQFGAVKDLRLGQRVIAIGNALGEFSNTVTTGVVSGMGRTVSAGSGNGSIEQLQQVIQTDAAINPGNSGGPLLNLAGQVIGVNTAIDQSGQLVGFAISSDEAKRVLDDVKQYGKVMRPFLGVRYIMLSPEMAKEQKLTSDYGAWVTKGDNAADPAVVAGSAADKAGLKEGDIIIEINGKILSRDVTLSLLLRDYKPGAQVVLKIKRGNETKELLVTLGQAT